MIITIVLFCMIFVSVLFLILPFGKIFIWAYGRGEDRLRLEDRKDAALLAIHDVDFEYAAGKITHEDYRNLRDRYKIEAAQVLRKMDENTLASDKGISPDLHNAIKWEVQRIQGLENL